MTIKVTYDKDIDSIVIKVTGMANYDDVSALGEQILNIPNFRININQLFDCSEGELDLSFDDIKRIASDFNKIAGHLGYSRKLALVVSRDVDFGMMRQYEVFFNAGPDVSLRSYRSLLDAKEWLKNDYK